MTKPYNLIQKIHRIILEKVYLFKIQYLVKIKYKIVQDLNLFNYGV